MKRTLFLFLLFSVTLSLFSQELITPSGRQQLLASGQQSRIYLVESPEESTGRYLLLEYTATSPGKLRIDFSEGSSSDLRYYAGRHRQLISFSPDSSGRLTGLSFSPEGEWDSIYLQRAYLSEDVPQNATLKTDGRIFEIKLSPGDPGWSMDILSPEGALRQKGTVFFTDAQGNEEGFEIILNQGFNPVYIYRHEVALNPVSCRLEIPERHLLRAFYIHDIPDSGPLPADPNSVLLWPRDHWRNPDYEIFRWSRFDNIYIALFKDQPTQSSYLKRICFHQEKKWARGQILNDDELAKRRGWNAHDYGADGIADFFTQAEEEDFPLGPGDLKFRQLALDLGLIYKNSKGGYVSNGGAFISLQQERPYSARKFYVSHEGAHGIFFTHPDFKDFIYRLWEEQSEEAKSVWKSFLWKYSYDSDYEYLVVNEFQAYLIQRNRNSADWYFNDRWRKLFEGHKKYEEVDRFLSENPEYFNKTAEKVENYMVENYGFITGDLGMIRRVD